MVKRIAINGFGRIGRLCLRRALLSKTLQVVAINDLVSVDNLAYLFKHDSVHGMFPESVSVEGEVLHVGKHKIAMQTKRDAKELPWKDLQVDYVVESTGHYTKREMAEHHRQAGAKRVLISAPGKDKVPTFVMGVNHTQWNPEEDFILSNASCTTNCLAPMCKVLLEHFGIEEGLMTTVHSLTASQPSVDEACSKDWRSGRAASINIIPASTGAAKATALCLPELKGKLTGMAFRVPTPNVSVVDLTVRLFRDASLEEIYEKMDHAANSDLKGILATTKEQLVSSDLIGNTHSCIYDHSAGIALNPRFFKLIGWYDNELGYSQRVIDLLEYMAVNE